jgi:hypothetical protein
VGQDCEYRKMRVRTHILKGQANSLLLRQEAKERLQPTKLSFFYF